MKLPNKLFSYRESVISKFPIILSILVREGHLTIYELYIHVNNKFDSITEFIDVIECLFVLGKIEYDYQSRRVRYVA